MKNNEYSDNEDTVNCIVLLDTMRNLYIYNACIYIHYILITGSDGGCGGQACPRAYS